MFKLNDLVAVVSIVSSAVSIILAVLAIVFSRRVEERLKKNFMLLKNIMDKTRREQRKSWKTLTVKLM